MLVLSRKEGDSIVYHISRNDLIQWLQDHPNDDFITFTNTVTKINGNRVAIGFNGPKMIRAVRTEIDGWPKPTSSPTPSE